MSAAPDSLAVQTASPEAQEIERRIHRAWSVFEKVRKVPSACARLREPVARIAAQVRTLNAPVDDWQVLAHKATELEQAVCGDALNVAGLTVVPSVPAVPSAPSVPAPTDLSHSTDVPHPAMAELQAELHAELHDPPTRKQIELPDYAQPEPEAVIALPQRSWAIVVASLGIANLLSISVSLALARRLSTWTVLAIAVAPLVGLGTAAAMIWRRPWNALLERVTRLDRGALGRRLARVRLFQ